MAQALIECNSFDTVSTFGPIVYRLGRDPLTVESGVRFSVGSQIETSSEESAERAPGFRGGAFILPRRSAAYSDGGGILKCMDLLAITGFVPTLRTKLEISC